MGKGYWVIALLLVSCGGDSDSTLFGTGGTDAGVGGGNTGGSNTGGANTGGSNTGGANTGGSNTGGANTGGANTGGANTGGANTGGANTGGANTGGANTGGANTGGANTGGANTGGANTGGANTGGAGTGGAAGSGTGGGSSGGMAGSSTGGTGGSATGGAAGSGTGGSNTGGAAGSATGGTGGGNTGGAAGSGGSAGAGGCPVAGCGMFTCCNDTCVNTDNDINNCGGCGVKCTGSNPFCNNGTCGIAPCSSGTTCNGGKCCGTDCCTGNELCCEVNVSVTTLGCYAPVDGTCPKGCPWCVCDSADTLIATPSGEREIADLREGDLVYSIDRGAVRAVPIRLRQRQPAPHHVVVELRFETGSVLHVSQRHPTADGRVFGDLHGGDEVDGVRVVSAKLVPYQFDATYDILPSSDTGTYFASGVLIASTIAGAPQTFRGSSMGSAPASGR